MSLKGSPLEGLICLFLIFSLQRCNLGQLSGFSFEVMLSRKITRCKYQLLGLNSDTVKLNTCVD